MVFPECGLGSCQFGRSSSIQGGVSTLYNYFKRDASRFWAGSYEAREKRSIVTIRGICSGTGGSLEFQEELNWVV